MIPPLLRVSRIFCHDFVRITSLFFLFFVNTKPKLYTTSGIILFHPAWGYRAPYFYSENALKRLSHFFITWITFVGGGGICVCREKLFLDF